MEHQGQSREIPSTRILSAYNADTIITKMIQALHIDRNIIYDKKWKPISPFGHLSYQAVHSAFPV